MQKASISKHVECSCTLGLDKIQNFEDQPIKTNHVYIMLPILAGCWGGSVGQIMCDVSLTVCTCCALGWTKILLYQHFLPAYKYMLSDTPKVGQDLSIWRSHPKTIIPVSGQALYFLSDSYYLLVHPSWLSHFLLPLLDDQSSRSWRPFMEEDFGFSSAFSMAHLYNPFTQYFCSIDLM